MFFNRSAKIKEICLQYAIPLTSYYRLVQAYRLWGPWAVIPANLPGKETMSSETRVSNPIYGLLPAKVKGFDALAELALESCLRRSVAAA